MKRIFLQNFRICSADRKFALFSSLLSYVVSPVFDYLTEIGFSEQTNCIDSLTRILPTRGYVYVNRT